MKQTERKNITAPPDWWEAWNEAASKSGVTLSEWIGEQCNAKLPAKTQGKLSERVSRGRPSK